MYFLIAFLSVNHMRSTFNIDYNVDLISSNSFYMSRNIYIPVSSARILQTTPATNDRYRILQITVSLISTNIAPSISVEAGHQIKVKPSFQQQKITKYADSHLSDSLHDCAVCRADDIRAAHREQTWESSQTSARHLSEFIGTEKHSGIK